MAEVRFFRMMGIREAMAFAEIGGIAVHKNFDVTGEVIGGKVRSGRAYHVLGLREPLIEWGRSHGQRENWLQRPHGIAKTVWHYDVFGGPARRLERELGIAEEAENDEA